MTTAIIQQIENLLQSYARFYLVSKLKENKFRNSEIARILGVTPGRITQMINKFKEL